MCPQKTKLISHITLGFVLYLLLFSTFALFHAYANNELSDAHGCQIGMWVQHGQAATLSVVLLSTALASLPYFNPPINLLNPSPFRSTASSRAPPLLTLL